MFSRAPKSAPLFAIALLSMTGIAQADPQPAPPPPAVVYPEVPEAQNGGEAATPEPGEVRRRSTRGSTPGVLIENGEDGTDGVEDHTSAAYELLQSDVAAQGDFAFHLATNEGHWFKLIQSVAITDGCKLFFQSRIRFATTSQVGTVQISTDGGATWPTDVWTQAGTDGSGETNFTLHEVDLSSFDGSTIQVRFLYDFQGGSWFPQTSSIAGWFVDNIQIGSEFSKDQYTQFGDPSDDEQLYAEYINRARADASAEATRLANETDPQITSVYSSRSIDTDDISTQYAWAAANGCLDEIAQPLAFNEKLLQMARLHSLDMFTNSFQGHVSSSSPPAPYQPGDTLGNRRDRIGYSGGALGENVFAYSRSVAYGHAGFLVDWGNTTNNTSACYNPDHVGQGMQNPPGHRLSTHNNTYNEIGVGVITDSNGGVGPQLVTQNLGAGSGSQITGVVYEDSNSNNFYDPGEGISGVRVESPGSAFFSVTSTSGGYAIPIDSDGTHEVTFSGGGVANSIQSATISGGLNAKLDYLASTAISGYAAWADSLNVTEGETGDDDGDGVANLLEYAITGMDPHTPDNDQLPTLVSGSGGALTLTIDKNTAAAGLTYLVQTSSDLDEWVDTGYTIITDDSNTLEVSFPGTATRLFTRISVTSDQ